MSFTMGEEGLRVWSRVPIARSGFNFIDIKCGPQTSAAQSTVQIICQEMFPSTPTLYQLCANWSCWSCFSVRGKKYVEPILHVLAKKCFLPLYQLCEPPAAQTENYPHQDKTTSLMLHQTPVIIFQDFLFLQFNPIERFSLFTGIIQTIILPNVYDANLIFVH